PRSASTASATSTRRAAPRDGRACSPASPGPPIWRWRPRSSCSGGEPTPGSCRLPRGSACSASRGRWRRRRSTPLKPRPARAGTVVAPLGVGDQPAGAGRAAEIAAEERTRSSSDRRWTIAFLITLFAIHSARLQTDGTLLGYLAPAIAVVGDAALALLFAFL